VGQRAIDRNDKSINHSLVFIIAATVGGTTSGNNSVGHSTNHPKPDHLNGLMDERASAIYQMDRITYGTHLQEKKHDPKGCVGSLGDIEPSLPVPFEVYI
jgi:hypothetical protein